MAAVAQVGDQARPAVSTRPGRGEIIVALAAFAVLCVVVLLAAPVLVEPDDYAYRASIVAMTNGHFLTLSAAAFRALEAQLSRLGSAAGPGGISVGPRGALPSIAQWVEVSNGRWISEKDPGYPFLAAPFQALGIIRLAPLFYGALACLGLFFGARRWLGRFGGATTVGLYCSSGAALLFAWRDYMPTFTDASLLAAGTGALLWAILASDASEARRTWIGLAGFVAIEAAAFSRYTDIVVLGCAVAAVLLVRWRRPEILPHGALWWWLGSAVVFCAGVALFDDLVYGGPLRSGYRPGEIQFSLSATGPNLRYMPAHLLQAMPVLMLGLAALVWMAARWARLRHAPDGGPVRTDAAVGLALAASWLAIWGLYAAYSWTAGPGLSTLQAARFYVPAIGAIALLGAWLVTRVASALPGGHVLQGGRAIPALACVAVVAALFGIGIWSFNDMRAFRLGSARIVRLHGPIPVKQRPPGAPSGIGGGPGQPPPGAP
ncbi:MAG TPA: hypothetical protein VLX31_11380 [Streptosporangiaceae bacterium]|nr:hypothetical protein [Streptosporangiaceae bacterium]